MADSHHCRHCNAELAPDAPEGLCPACLLRQGAATLGISDDVRLGGTTSEGESHHRGAFKPPSPGELASSFPHLEILEFLGQGGMGAVYKARQPRLDRLVALKILAPALAADRDFAERFTREARALARLSHPNVVAVYDFGESQGLYYLIMEFVDGPNLRQLLLQGNPKPAEVLAIVPQICEALQYAHDTGVVHRDIKPENILLDRKGRVKIADFGLAKLRRDGGPATLTGTGLVMGTPHYMAPEQLESPRLVDHRADIYSLGVVFYELLTRELPLGRFAPPSTKVQVDVRLDEVVLRALEKEPQRRYQHASELKSGVETLGGTPATTRAGGVTGPASDSGGFEVLETATPVPFEEAPSPRLCKLPVIGAFWAPFGVLALLMFFTLRTSPVLVADQPDPGARIDPLQYLAIPIGLIGLAAPVGCTALGIAGISRIRRSAGQLYGSTLSVTVALLYPILLLDGLLLGLFYSVKRDTDLWNALLLAWVLLIIIADICIFAWVWKAATRKEGP